MAEVKTLGILRNANGLAAWLKSQGETVIAFSDDEAGQRPFLFYLRASGYPSAHYDDLGDLYVNNKPHYIDPPPWVTIFNYEWAQHQPWQPTYKQAGDSLWQTLHDFPGIEALRGNNRSGHYYPPPESSTPVETTTTGGDHSVATSPQAKTATG